MKEKIEFSEFLEIEKKLEIRVGEIIKVERVEKSNKMLKFTVDFGNDKKISVSNIGKGMSDENIQEVYKNYVSPFVTNLKPTKIMGIESEVMILVPTINDKICCENLELGALIL